MLNCIFPLRFDLSTDRQMDRLSSSVSAAVFFSAVFFTCGHSAAVVAAGDHKGHPRHLLWEEDVSLNKTQLARK